MTFRSAVPVLQVSDVSRSVQWYRDVLGFDGSTFPDSEPYSFALLCRDGVELMLQRSSCAHEPDGWSVYIRLTGSELLGLAADVRSKTELSREIERMPYCDVEFSVADPDGHEIVLSEQLPDSANVPRAAEGRAT